MPFQLLAHPLSLDATLIELCAERRHGLGRCRYHGLEGIKRWVGLGAIASNLITMGAALAA